MRPPGGLLFEPPINWVFEGKSSMPSVLFTELKSRDAGALRDIVRFDNLCVHKPASRDHWFEELFYTRVLQEERQLETLVLDVFGRILCKALEVPRDCDRELHFYQQHNFLFFTNHRTIQVYCWHDTLRETTSYDSRNLIFSFKPTGSNTT